jgi:UDPglucose 6-dehydrogenase
MPELTAKKITRSMGNKSEKIGMLGLSFKPGSDDVRDSSAAKIITVLIDNGFRNIYAYDPLAVQEFGRVYGFDITYCSSAAEVCDACEIVALVTAWKDFAGIDKLFPNIRWVDCRYFLGRREL